MGIHRPSSCPGYAEQTLQVQSRQIEALEEKEIGGPKGPEPTRYGDWEVKGRVSDF